MTSYKHANGEARTSDFVTLSSMEFYSNQRDSFRLCVTAVKGKPMVNLSKLWFNSQEEKWLPTRKHFYFSKEAWEALVKQISKLNTEIHKMGLFGMRLLIQTHFHLFSNNIKYFALNLLNDSYFSHHF